jgi:hypothetical protein
MPMNANTLGTAIWNEIKNSTDPEAAWQAVAQKIIDHFIANAAITIQPGTTANGVSTGGASVPVTGTAKVTS